MNETNAETTDGAHAELDLDVIDRRSSPGRRSTDIEHDAMAVVIAALKRGKRMVVFASAVSAAIGSAGMWMLMVFGLRVGGAADLSTLRRETHTADSVLEAGVARHDALIAANRVAITRLEQRDEIKMIVLCVIADKVNASTGGYCADYVKRAR